MLSHPESRLRMAEIIGSKLNISKEKVFNKHFDIQVIRVRAPTDGTDWLNK